MAKIELKDIQPNVQDISSEMDKEEQVRILNDNFKMIRINLQILQENLEAINGEL